MAAHQDAELGGMQLPWTVTQACFALFPAANISTSAYPFLTIAAANLLQAPASPEQVGLYLHPMLERRFHGTMALRAEDGRVGKAGGRRGHPRVYPAHKKT